MPNPFPDGHFYSPIVNIEDIKQAQAKIWPSSPQVLGINFNDASHQHFLTQEFPQYLKDYDYPLEKTADNRFFHNNPNFSWLDAKTLFVMLRALKPRRLIEIGSGYSSLLTADVNQRFLHRHLEFTCIEPYPADFLVAGVPGIQQLLPNKVEELPFSTFTQLQAGDILFIDSSHVAKTGSDVNTIYFDIIPRLAAGVIIHIHDIFLPTDYPKEWVIDEGRSWNEQYVLRALLMFTNAFEVIFGCHYALLQHADLLKTALNGELYGGGSFWIKKIK
ncbi:MAG: hypothetical protein BWK79_18900 [Beggiatoa sp. IS2]|nr:MAG: hypothetical protein BWK79_18900 [Beggiatoa sp. IS2]